MAIATILQRKGDRVATVECDTGMRDVVALLARERIGAMPVMKDGRVAGIISERDIIQCLHAEGAAVLDWKVERVMTAPAITATPDMPVLAALSTMSKRRIRHLPVVDGDRLIGIVSIGDLVQHRIERLEQEAEAMRSYIQGS